MTQSYSKKARILLSNRESINEVRMSEEGHSEFCQTSIQSSPQRKETFLFCNIEYVRKINRKAYLSISEITKIGLKSTSLAKYFVVLAIPQFIWNIRAEATPGEVSTSVSISGSASYGYEEHHPIKWGCFGKNSTSAFDSDQTKEEVTYQTNQGSAALYNTIDEKRSVQEKVENQSVDWNFNYDKEDYSFHLKFKRNVGKGVEFYNRRACNTRSWHYRIDSATSKVHSSVNIVVPSNVWIVEIENLTKRIAGIDPKFKIKNVYSKINGGLALGDGMVYQPVHYFYVKPGDEITLELEFEDTGSDIDLVSELKVTFLDIIGVIRLSRHL
ncbi:MAG: hypothetical protein IPL83_07480 [Bdellovibrionales bacterium]|nr:hypothetical protein [Bdellovibrionales bacterium]